MLPIGSLVGRFRLTALLGAGGMGEVYRAHDERLRRDVALKFFHASAHGADAVDRFLREAQAASALNHPNIVTIHEVGEADFGRFIVMELVGGRSMRDEIGHPMAVDTLVQLGSQMARALAAAHAVGIMHRDIKPENIMVRTDGYVKLLDFGLARRTPVGDASSRDDYRTEAATEAGVVLGTFRYMSPEQAMGRPAEGPGDVFALGLVFYELLTGEHPFAHSPGLGILHAIAHQQTLAPSYLNLEIPAPMDALILRMLEKDPLMRPTAQEVGNTLVELSTSPVRITTPNRPASRRVVGRAREREEMIGAFESTVDGQGLMMCLTGEPGLGKSTLVEDFLIEIENGSQPCWTARGRCSERLADTEAYLPFIEALDSMMHSSRFGRAGAESAESIAGLMRRLAPAWYAQVAPLAVDRPLDRDSLAGKAESQEHLKRELITFFQEISRIRPFVLFLDDIHWADVSTTDLLAYLAARLPTMSMLVLTAYRQSDMLLGKHPFISIKLDLQSRGVLREVGLDFLSRDDIEGLLTLQFGGHTFPAEFAEVIHARTEGNPLFIVDLLRDLQARKVIAESRGRWTLADDLSKVARELPESVRSMIRRKIDQLTPEDRSLLVTASVQGPEFESTVVARALNLDPGDVEERLVALDQVYAFVRRRGERELPDGSLTVVYSFVHVLYQNELYGTLTPTRRVSLSAAVASAVEGAYGPGNAQLATKLALLFDAARDFEKAAEYLLLAARGAARIFAHHEAVTLSKRGIALLEKLPSTVERATIELSLQIALGSQVLATKGYAAPELGGAYTRARALCDQVGSTRLLLPVLLGLGTYHTVRAEYDQAREFAEDIVVRAQEFGDTWYPARAGVLLGVNTTMLGRFADTIELLEPLTSFEQPRDGSWMSVYGAAPSVSSRGYLAFALLLMGYPDRALTQARLGLRHAEALEHPLSMVSARRYTWWICQLRRDTKEAAEHASALSVLSGQQGFAFYQAWGRIENGFAMSQLDDSRHGLEELRKGVEALRATGAWQLSTYSLSLLAEAYVLAGQPSDGLGAIDEALAFSERSGETFFEAELRRMQGEMLLRGPAPDLARVEECFVGALEVARRQEARWLELRAAKSLAQFWRGGPRQAEGLGLLKRVYNRFTEGLETPDLREALEILNG